MSTALVFNNYGGPETQELIDLQSPTAGPGEVAIEVKAAGVNPADWKLREGLLGETGQLPAPLGLEASGVVTAVGDGVEDFAVGDEVLGLVAEAVAEGRHLCFTYTDQYGRSTEREVQPYRHVLRDGTWYLVGYDMRRGEWRVFRLDRIQEAAVRPAPPGDEPRDFPGGSIEEWISTDFGRR